MIKKKGVHLRGGEGRRKKREWIEGRIWKQIDIEIQMPNK